MLLVRSKSLPILHGAHCTRSHCTLFRRSHVHVAHSEELGSRLGTQQPAASIEFLQNCTKSDATFDTSFESDTSCVADLPIFLQTVTFDVTNLPSLGVSVSTGSPPPTGLVPVPGAASLAMPSPVWTLVAGALGALMLVLVR